jgi:hypothetical protein
MNFVTDPLTGKPSVTLMFFLISYAIASGVNIASSVMLLMQGELLTATYAPGLATLAGFVFYRLRQLDKIKIDFATKSIELTDEKEQP